MTEKKATSGGATGNRPKRKSRSKTPPFEPTPSALARAVRRLHAKLGAIVAQLDAGKRNGKTDEQTWETIRFEPESRSTPVSGVRRALNAYTEQSMHGGIQFRRTTSLASLALKVARGEVRAELAIARANEVRGTADRLGEPSRKQLKGDVLKARGEFPKWKAAYYVLAFDADVWPRPDSARGVRGAKGEQGAQSPLRSLYGLVTFAADVRSRGVDPVAADMLSMSGQTATENR